MEHFTARVLTLLANDSQLFNFDLPLQGDCLAALEDLRLEGHEPAPSTLLISLTAHVKSMVRSMHYAAAPPGASGTTSQRLYWIGDTPARWVRARLRRDARHVDWRLFFHSTRIKELSISARVEHIKCLPASLERAFGDLLQGDG